MPAPASSSQATLLYARKSRAKKGKSASKNKKLGHAALGATAQGTTEQAADAETQPHMALNHGSATPEYYKQTCTPGGRWN